jgi:dipeptide transport system ATP-binding protein
MALLKIRNLNVEFATGRGVLKAVDSLDLDVDAGEVLGIVGESGSGKSVAMLAVMGLIAFPGKVRADAVELDGQDLLALSDRQRRRVVGRDIAMIFQEPMTSLNPCFTVGFQITEALAAHEGGSRDQLRTRAVELLDQVGIPAPESRLSAFPHQLSGGMNQRVMIAMAIACSPRLLIADEPTTALDVTIQAQILELLTRLQRERGMALVLITHDMGVIAETADRVAVMYAGRIAEIGPVGAVIADPQHPYTVGLMGSIPKVGRNERRLAQIDGAMPRLNAIPSGCAFRLRCPEAFARCATERPELVPAGQSQAACWLHHAEAAHG